MTAITTYDTLIANVKAEAEDDGVEFAEFIPTAIDLAENKIIKTCDFPELESKYEGEMTKGYTSIAKPSDYTHTHYLALTKTDGTRTLLKRKTDDYILDYWPNSTEEGVPKYYADENETSFVVAPTPSANYAYSLKYTQAPEKLSTLNQTNYFTERCVEMLFYATMVEMSKFMKSWSQVEAWKVDFNDARDLWNLEAARQRRDDGSNPHNPEGGQNTLAHTLKSGSTA